MSADAVTRRRRVLDLRIRLERAAVAAYRAVCAPTAPVSHGHVRVRLLFLVALVEPDRRAEAHRLAHLARYVYARTSDVLHGRASARDVPDVVVDEWSAVVDGVVALMRGTGREGSATTTSAP